MSDFVERGRECEAVGRAVTELSRMIPWARGALSARVTRNLRFSFTLFFQRSRKGQLVFFFEIVLINMSSLKISNSGSMVTNTQLYVIIEHIQLLGFFVIDFLILQRATILNFYPIKTVEA